MREARHQRQLEDQQREEQRRELQEQREQQQKPVMTGRVEPVPFAPGAVVRPSSHPLAVEPLLRFAVEPLLRSAAEHNALVAAAWKDVSVKRRRSRSRSRSTAGASIGSRSQRRQEWARNVSTAELSQVIREAAKELQHRADALSSDTRRRRR